MNNTILNEDIIKILKENYYLPNSEGHFEHEINADYRDVLGPANLKVISESTNQREAFHDVFETSTAEWQEEDYLVGLITGKLDDKYELTEHDTLEEYVREWVENNFTITFPFSHYLKQEVIVNLTINSGDGNFDYTLNNLSKKVKEETDEIREESSLLWLTLTQGYTKEDLLKAYRTQDYSGSKFIKSVYVETDNVSSNMNALVFLVKMTLGEYLDLCESENDYKVVRTVTTGLYDRWNGAGGCLEIELEKDVLIPRKYLDPLIDGSFGYSLADCYGVNTTLWKKNLAN